MLRYTDNPFSIFSWWEIALIVLYRLIAFIVHTGAIVGGWLYLWEHFA